MDISININIFQIIYNYFQYSVVFIAYYYNVNSGDIGSRGYAIVK